MAVKRCPTCGVYIEWLRTRYGRKLPFELPISVGAEGASEGWVPGQWSFHGRKTVVLYPLADSSRTRAANIRQVVLPHRCDTYYRDMFERAMHYTKEEVSR